MNNLKKILLLKSLLLLTLIAFTFHVDVAFGAKKKSLITDTPPAVVNVNSAYSFVPTVKAKKSELKRFKVHY